MKNSVPTSRRGHTTVGIVKHMSGLNLRPIFVLSQLPDEGGPAGPMLT